MAVLCVPPQATHDCVCIFDRFKLKPKQNPNTITISDSKQIVHGFIVCCSKYNPSRARYVLVVEMCFWHIDMHVKIHNERMNVNVKNYQRPT